MKKQKEPTLFSKLITIYHEQAQRKKAMRLLMKQSWSVEFLIAVVAKAATITNRQIELTLTNKEGITMTISSTQFNSSNKFDDNIFNHLDDDIAINAFIRDHSTR